MSTSHYLRLLSTFRLTSIEDVIMLESLVKYMISNCLFTSSEMKDFYTLVDEKHAFLEATVILVKINEES